MLLLLLCFALFLVISVDLCDLWALCKLKCEVIILLCIALCGVRSVEKCDCLIGVNRILRYCCYWVLHCVWLDLLVCMTVELV